MKKYILKFKMPVLLYLIAGTIVALEGIAMTYTIQYIVEIVSYNRIDEASHMFLAVLALLIFMTATSIFFSLTKHGFCAKIMEAIRTDLFQSIIRKNMVDFSKENTGYYTSLFQNDLKVVETTIIAKINFVLQLEEIVFSLLYAFLQNAVIGVVLMLVGIAGMAIPMLSQKMLRKNQENLMKEAAKHNSFINDSLHGYEVIKNYQAEENILGKYGERNCEYRRKTYKTVVSQSLTGNLAQTLIVALQMLLIALSGVMVFQGRLDISFLTVIVGLSSSVINSMYTAVEAMIEQKSGQGVCKKIFGQIEAQGKAEEETGIDFKDSLALKEVSFSYPNEEKPVLENINVTFRKGKKYLLLGESGSGKSTFIKLLLQYYGDYQGKMYLDGMDVRTLPGRSVMRQFAVISQNVFVFEDTLRNNITLYDSYSDESIMEAVRKAGLEKLVDKLENGLGYVIKEDGLNLSGGERQRISIARAFLHNRNIWIMDEATSNLDKEMAEQIGQTVLNIPEITVIMIAHYYNEKTVAGCDEIFRIEKGNLCRL